MSDEALEATSASQGQVQGVYLKTVALTVCVCVCLGRAVLTRCGSQVFSHTHVSGDTSGFT